MSDDQLALVFVFLLIGVVFVLGLRRDKESNFASNASQSLAGSSATDRENEGSETLLKLSGFDQNGSPLSLSIKRNHILLDRGYVVGRSREFSDLAIDHQRISRAHVHFTYENGGVFASDLNSTNGTFLNGIQLRAFVKTRVNPSDELKVADIVLAISR